MSNEALLVIRALVDLLLVFLAFRLFGRRGLFVAIVANLILVTLFGGKLISYFGFITNAGNVFYAAVFFAVHIMIEHYGFEESLKTIGVGILGLVLFLVMGFLSLYSVSIPQTQAVSDALKTILQIAPRIAFGSLFAYLIAQFVNIRLYNYFRTARGNMGIWFRSLASLAVAQLLDSVIFFSIAFVGMVELPVLAQALITGFIVKVLVGVMGIPFLYTVNRYRVGSIFGK